MITYFYWIGILLVVGALLYGFGIKAKTWKTGGILALIVFLIGWGAYYFSFQQVFVKRYGGEMTIKVPNGFYHVGMTWKDDNLWIENYDPKTGNCYFTEYSKGNLLQGKVIIKNCNPFANK